MKWLIKTVILLDALALLLHGLALTLLMTLKNQILRGSQKLLLITLCVTELIYAVVDITYKTLQLLFGMNTIYYSFWVFNVITIVLMYISVMTLLTIERFLEIYLNIKIWLTLHPNKDKICFTLNMHNLFSCIYSRAFNFFKQPYLCRKDIGSFYIPSV